MPLRMCSNVLFLAQKHHISADMLCFLACVIMSIFFCG